MNNRTKYRAEQALLRAKKMNRQRDKYIFMGLSSSCLLLTVCLLGMFNTVANGFPSDAATVTGFYGAVLLRGDVSAYVLTGLLAFAAGVIVTALCIRSQRKKKHKHHIID